MEVTKKTTTLADQITEARQQNKLSEFGNIPHRLELVTNLNGVDYVNDSKATDINSTWYSLEYLDEGIIWIVGTSDIEADFSLFKEIVQDKVRAIVCLGKNRTSLFQTLATEVELFAEAESITEAVEIASNYSINNDVVLFSPACSSYDMFQDYKDRGEQFVKAVNGLEQ